MVVRVILGGVGKLRGAFFCFSVFVYAYGSGCIGVSVCHSVCCKEGSVVSVCICVYVCVCMSVCMCVLVCEREIRREFSGIYPLLFILDFSHFFYSKFVD